MTISLETLTTDPSGNENGLVVRNIPSGIQNISADGYLATQAIKDIDRVIKTFTAFNFVGTSGGVESMITFTPYTDFVAGSTGTSFSVTSGKRLRLQTIFIAGSAVGVLPFRIRISNSGSVTTSTPVCMSVSGSITNTVTITFPDSLELSENMQFGISQDSTGTGNNFSITIIGYEY